MDQDLPTKPQKKPRSDPPPPPPSLPPPPGPRLPRPLQWLLIGAALFVLVIVFFGTPAVLHLFGPSQPAPATGEPSPASEGSAFKPTDRQWATLKLQTVQDRTFQPAAETDGKIAIDDDLVTPVFSPFSGRVTRLMARAGDTVQRGDPLFAIQATELAQAQNDLISAAAGLRTATAQLNLAETNEKRQHALYQAQGAALKDWQQARVDLATAQGGMNSAQIALSSVRNRLRILGKTDADIAAIEATPDLLALNADSVVRAPIGGTVVQRQVGLGQNIVSASAGASSPVFMIGDVSKVWMVANAREGDAPYLHKGDPLEVRLPAYPGRVFKGRLNYVAASLDAVTHRLPVRAEVENPDLALKPEMIARFRILTGADVENPAVPAAAVVYEGDTAHVWAADDTAKTLEIRPIKPGRSVDGMIEVLAGLKPGDKVVTAGAVFIDRAASGD
jgi:cobalt-zinc-cadmium efflux system membrane fusion protein